MKSIIVHHNTGLGDHLICNGMINFLSLKKKVYLISNKKNYYSIRYLYSENPNVTVLPIFRNNKFEFYLLKVFKFFFTNLENSSEQLLSRFYSIILRKKVVYVGFNDVTYPEWDKSFYTSIGLDFNIRYDYFCLPAVLPKKPNKIPKNFAFIQDVSSQGKYKLEINTSLKKIFLGEYKSKNFFDNLHFIYEAKEIHCIDSSLVHLVEGLNLVHSPKLLFHDVERYNQASVPDARFNMRHNWEIIKYKEESSFY